MKVHNASLASLLSLPTGSSGTFVMGGAPYCVVDPENEAAAIENAEGGGGIQNFEGVASSAPPDSCCDKGSCRGKREVSEARPLKVLAVFDWAGESASAARMQRAVEELAEIGHEVVVIRPGYRDAPEMVDGRGYTVHTMLFRPQGEHGRDWVKSGSYLRHDVPVLEKNPRVQSRQLLSQLGERELDRFIISLLAWERFAHVMHGPVVFDAAITQHLGSLWNYVLGPLYPTLAITSESDGIPANSPPALKRLMELGAERVSMVAAFSCIAVRRLGQFDVDNERLSVAAPQIDRDLFTYEGENKKTVLARFSELSGISPESVWVVLRDESGASDVVRHLAWVAAEIERENSNLDISFIFLSRGGAAAAAEAAAGHQLQHFCSIDIGDRFQEQALLSVADRAVMYLGTEAPPHKYQGVHAGENYPPSGSMELDRLERRLQMTSQLAMMVRSPDGPTFYQPGYGSEFSGTVIDDAISDFELSADEFMSQQREQVVAYLRHVKEEKTWEWDAFSGMNSEDALTVQNQARQSVFYRLHKIASSRFAGAVRDADFLSNEGLPLRQERHPHSLSASASLNVEHGLAAFLEPMLYRIAERGVSKCPALAYGGAHHTPFRTKRLMTIVPDMDVRGATEKLINAILLARDHEARLQAESGAQGDPRAGRWHLRDLWRGWMTNVLRALYTSNFRHPVGADAIPDPGRNPNGVLSEIARLSNVPTKFLVEYILRAIEETPASHLLRHDDGAGRQGPPDPVPAEAGSGHFRGSYPGLRRVSGGRHSSPGGKLFQLRGPGGGSRGQ